MADPWQWFSASEIARVTSCPQANVESNWPLIARALERRVLWERDVAGAVIATVAIETASTFEPLHEYGTPADWSGYSGGAAYAGRGFIQLTHDYNYRAAGTAIGIDLVSNPDRAMEPAIAADVLAWFWATKTVPAKDGLRVWTLAQLCREHDWEWVRRAVQGGTAGLDRLVQIATDLGGGAMPTVRYDPNAPAIAQDDPWSCAPTSLRWALTALGRTPGPNYIEDLLVRDGVVSHDQGLLDASGAGIAAWVGKKGAEYYGDEGFYANSEPSVTFDGAALEGDHAYPLLIGGRAWGHWSGVRGYDAARDLLLLANPADGWMGVQQTMSRAQWDQLGPFSMVRVLHPDLLGEPAQPPPVVVPPAPPIPTVDKAAIIARLRGLLALHDAYDIALRAEFAKLIEMAEEL